MQLRSSMSLFKVLENMNYEGYPKTYRFRIISENLGEGFKELCWFFFFFYVLLHIFLETSSHGVD
jgi:hypothetical protein